jgi:hypothetical protein
VKNRPLVTSHAVSFFVSCRSSRCRAVSTGAAKSARPSTSPSSSRTGPSRKPGQFRLPSNVYIVMSWLSILDIDILTVGNLDSDIFMVGNLDVDQVT